MYRVAGYSNVGLRKKTNQDSCCAEVAVTPYGDTALLVMCDGVGGLSSGELASYSVIRWLTDWFETSYPALIELFHDNLGALFSRVQGEWENGLERLNSVLRSYGRVSQSKLGTTCTAILFFNGQHVIAHIGDCRVYRFAETGGMEQLTDDQTWVAREVARGNITPEQARSHPKKNVILQSVGTQDGIQTVFTRGFNSEGDVYLVCCDGFRNELFDDELMEKFSGAANRSESILYTSCENLADLVMSRNEYDNISAVVLACSAGGSYDMAAQNASADTTTAMKPIVVTGSVPAEEDLEPTTDLGEPAGGQSAYYPGYYDQDAFSDMTVVLDDEGGDPR